MFELNSIAERGVLIGYGQIDRLFVLIGGGEGILVPRTSQDFVGFQVLFCIVRIFLDTASVKLLQELWNLTRTNLRKCRINTNNNIQHQESITVLWNSRDTNTYLCPHRKKYNHQCWHSTKNSVYVSHDVIVSCFWDALNMKMATQPLWVTILTW